MNKEFTTLYTNWLLANTLEDEVSPGIFKITLPFIESCHGALVVIYVIKKENNTFLLTDDGDTLHELEMSGLSWTEKRKELLKSTISSHGVSFDEESGELSITATKKHFGNAKHALLQTIMKVYDMYTLKKEHISSIFNEDVKAVLQEKNIFFAENPTVTGLDAINYQYDFSVSNQSGVTYYIKTINSPTKDKILAALYCCEKSKESKNNDIFTIVFNDQHDKFSNGMKSIIGSNHDVPAMPLAEFSNSVYSWQHGTN